VEPSKNKSAGYSLERVDMELQRVWRQEFYAEKGNAQVYEIWIAELGLLNKVF
jgi:hypothetical protein